MIALHDTIPSRSAPIVTWSLIALNDLVFLYELALPAEELEHFIHLFGIVPARYTHPEADSPNCWFAVSYHDSTQDEVCYAVRFGFVIPSTNLRAVTASSFITSSSSLPERLGTWKE